METKELFPFTARILRIGLLMAVIWGCQTAHSQIINRDNMETSIALDIPIPEIDSLSLDLEHLDRWNGFFDERTEYYYQGFLRYSLPALKSWSLGLGYRRKTDDLLGGGDDKQNRYMLDLSYKRNRLFGSKWDLGFRNRWELIDSSEVDDTQRVRGRLKLRRDIPYLHIQERPLQFQIYDEIYYDLNEGAFSQNSAGIGLVFPFLRKAEFTINAEWKNVGSIGDNQEGDNTALVTFTLAYSLEKDWFANLVGGEVGERWKSDENRSPAPVPYEGSLSEMPQEPLLHPESQSNRKSFYPQNNRMSPLEEIPWESN